MAIALTVALFIPTSFHLQTVSDIQAGRTGQRWTVDLATPCFPTTCEPATKVQPVPPPEPPPPLPEPMTDDWPAEWVTLISTYFQPEDVQAALKVVQCESGFVLTAKNPRSSALGPWQFLRDTWDRMVMPHTGSPSYDAGGPTDPVWSTINAAWLWYEVGPSQWECYR